MVPANPVLAAISDRLFFNACEGSPDLITISDDAGVVVYVNPSHQTLLGYAREELVGSSVLNFVHPDDLAAAALALLDAQRDKGEGGTVRTRLRRRDGGWLAVDTDTAILHDDERNWILFVSRVMRDAPDIRQKEVERLSAILRAQQATTPDGVIVATPNGQTISFNENYLRIWGLTAAQAESSYEERMGGITAQLVDPGAFKAFIDGLYQDCDQSMNGEYELLDGRVIEMHTSPFRTGDEPHGRVWFFRDVTERANAARAVRESEERYRRLVELSPNAIAVHSGGGIRYVNQAAQDLLGTPAADLLGRNVFEFVHPDDHAATVQATVERNFTSPRFVQVRLIRPDGKQLVVELGSSATTYDGQPATQTVLRDVTDRVKAERTLRESEERYRALVETAPDAIFMHDGRKISYANPAAAALLGFSDALDLVGKDPWDVLRGIPRAEFDDRIQKVMLGETFRAFERRFLTYLGTEVDVEMALAPAAVAGMPMVQVIMRDVSERRRAEEERLALERKLLETQKLESLGLLAGGIAHDFNNLLVAIMGNAGLATLEAEPGSSLETYLHEIESASQRAADLARQMLAYSGRGKFVVEHLDLSKVVRDIATLVAVSLPRKATIRYELADGLPLIEADATQLRQVIMNLVINAAEALGDGPGTITLETSTRMLGEDDLSGMSGHEAQPGSFACLRVSDTGCGMDPATTARIFDPFFTTKFTGRGLGLAAVLGIVRGHKGAISVASQPGSGTTFELFLPLSPNATQESHAGAAARRGEFSGRALVVDDEAHVRKVAASMLSSLGFEVLTAVSSEEALLLARDTLDGIALVVADQTMPGMDGCELVTTLRASGVQVPAVVMSGYSSSPAPACLEQNGAHFLPKPFTLPELERAVREALGAKTA